MSKKYTYPSAIEIRQAAVKLGDGPNSNPFVVANETFFALENRIRSLRISHMTRFKTEHPKKVMERELTTAHRLAESELLRNNTINTVLNSTNVTMGEDYVAATYGLEAADTWLKEYNLFERTMERFRDRWWFDKKNQVFADAMKEQALYVFHNVSEEVKKSNPDFDSYSELFCKAADLEIENAKLHAQVRDLKKKNRLHEQTLGLQIFGGGVDDENKLGTNEGEATMNNALVVRTSTDIVLKTPEKEGASAVAVSVEKETFVNKKAGGAIVPVLAPNRIKSYSDDSEDSVDNDSAKKRKVV